MTNIEKENSYNTSTITNNKFVFRFLIIIIVTSGYLICFYFDSVYNPRIADFSYSPILPLNISRIMVIFFLSYFIMLIIEVLDISPFPKTMMEEPPFILFSLLPPAASLILFLYLVILDISLSPSHNEWDETQTLLRRSISNHDSIGANQFYTQL